MYAVLCFVVGVCAPVSDELTPAHIIFCVKYTKIRNTQDRHMLITIDCFICISHTSST